MSEISATMYGQKVKDMIYLITLNNNGEQIETRCSVDELIDSWYHDFDIPTNDDTVVTCLLGKTQLYIETFGELMLILTGDKGE